MYAGKWIGPRRICIVVQRPGTPQVLTADCSALHVLLSRNRRLLLLSVNVQLLSPIWTVMTSQVGQPLDQERLFYAGVLSQSFFWIL